MITGASGALPETKNRMRPPTRPFSLFRTSAFARARRTRVKNGGRAPRRSNSAQVAPTARAHSKSPCFHGFWAATDFRIFEYTFS